MIRRMGTDSTNKHKYPNVCQWSTSSPKLVLTLARPGIPILPKKFAQAIRCISLSNEVDAMRICNTQNTHNKLAHNSSEALQPHPIHVSPYAKNANQLPIYRRHSTHPIQRYTHWAQTLHTPYFICKFIETHSCIYLRCVKPISVYAYILYILYYIMRIPRGWKRFRDQCALKAMPIA